MSRPTTARKVTPKSEKNRAAALDQAFGVRVDGKDYILVPADLTGLVEMRIRRETGLSVLELIHGIITSPGADMLGMFMWATRFAAGEDVDLVEVLESINFDSDAEVIEDAKPPAPEA